MALSFEELNQLYQTHHGRALPQEELKYLGGENGAWRNMSANEFVQNVIFPSAEYQSRGQREAQKVTNERQALLNQQKAEQEGLFSALEGKMAAQEKPSQAFGRLRQEAGLPALEEDYAGFQNQQRQVRNLLDYLPEDVENRTKGSLTTESQVRRMESVEGEALRNQLARLGLAAEPVLEAISKKSAMIGQQLQFLTAEQQKELQPMLLRIDMQADRFSREITGFNEGKAQELNAIMQQIARGQQIADRDLQYARDLAMQEKEWAQQKDQIATQFENQMKLQLAGISTVDLGDRVQYVNGAGDVIREEKKRSLAGSGGGAGSGSSALDAYIAQLMSGAGAAGSSGQQQPAGEAFPTEGPAQPAAPSKPFTLPTPMTTDQRNNMLFGARKPLKLF